MNTDEVYIEANRFSDMKSSYYEFDKIDDRIFILLGRGMSDKEIGRALNISYRTVQDRVQKAKKLMNAKNRIHLMMILLKRKSVLLERILFTILLFFVMASAKSQIAGGWLSFNVIGPSSPSTDSIAYLVVLNLYAQDSSSFPNTAKISIWNNDNNILHDSRVQPKEPQMLPVLEVSTPCVDSPYVPLGYWKARYACTFDLTLNVNGYFSSFQGCCRIAYTNVPGGQGMTYWVLIPPVNKPDSNPEFGL